MSQTLTESERLEYDALWYKSFGIETDKLSGVEVVWFSNENDAKRFGDLSRADGRVYPSGSPYSGMKCGYEPERNHDDLFAATA